MYQQQKRYTAAMDRFSDVRLHGHGVVTKAEKGWRGSGLGRPQVIAFAIATFSSLKKLNPLFVISHLCFDSYTNCMIIFRST